jgi:probable HAF family extracellular repeat protein
MKDLGTLGGSWSGAAGINNAGEIVGGSLLVTDTDSHAFLYSKGSMKDLNSLIDPASPLAMQVHLTSAVAINRRGQILANGFDVQSNVDGSYLLTPRHCSDKRSHTRNGGKCGEDDSSGDDCEHACASPPDK